MSTLSTCPYCGVQLGISSMRAHVALCNSCGPSGDNSDGRAESNGAPARTRTSDSFVPSTLEGSSCAEALIPSRAPSDGNAPQVFHLDLRTRPGERATANDAKPTMALSQLGPKRRSGQRRGSCSLPPSSCQRNDEQLSTAGESVGTGACSSPFGTSNTEPRKRADSAWNEECLNAKESGGGLASLNDPQLLERVSRLESMNRELYEALAVERDTHERSRAALEGALTFLRAELSTLHALVVGAANSAETAHYNLEDIETRLEKLPTEEAFQRLEAKVEDLFVWSRAVRQGTRLPQLAFTGGKNEKNTLVNLSAMNTPADPREIGCSAGRGKGTRSEGRDAPAGTPFLSKDTGETIAHLLQQQPAALIHTRGPVPAPEVSAALLGSG
ncbi:uncharacterized protein Tco025E_02669 [Trypanosoma conorhini]|uniref:Uncharacterized protein n=1 Tax=Trypanosoma conorhini TaxID=83891 RepID=A0A3R7LBN5_9TRYP|nr:uncharacterized protein Tco025E_02669 [Trypanosoma conorhini]RNF23965.1 hypothetical protein Tco025E_02669 [Trypanosoma conorhini]